MNEIYVDLLCKTTFEKRWLKIGKMYICCVIGLRKFVSNLKLWHLNKYQHRGIAKQI